ncbi:MAG TPA: CBS domain-containing protein [Anaerolineales bacterium]|jgi:CBS domain-containing protein|nr:CBS domain-containing protein [Anaerolineales bacterium]
MTTCSDVMTTNPVCAQADDTVVSVAQLMKEQDVGPIPIVDDVTTKRLQGIVTDRDLAMKVVAEGRDPNNTRVRDVMTTDVVTVSQDDDIQTALDAMSQHQLRRILVVDDKENLVGIIAQADIATRMNKPEQTGEVVKEISE